jgi:hypothetical protein
MQVNVTQNPPHRQRQVHDHNATPNSASLPPAAKDDRETQHQHSDDDE